MASFQPVSPPTHTSPLMLPSFIVVYLPILLVLLVPFSRRILYHVSTKVSRMMKGHVRNGFPIQHVASTIPIIGHVLHLQGYSAKYVHNLIMKTAAPLFTINIVNRDVIIANPSTERSFAKHAPDTGLAQILGIVGSSLFGLRDASVKFLAEYDPRPLHRDEFLSTLKLQKLSEASSAYAVKRIHGQPPVQEVNLGHWLFQFGILSTACAVWGEANIWHLDQEFREQFCLLTRCFNTLGRPFPQVTARQAYRCREFLLARLREFHAEHRETRTQSVAHRINAIAISDPNWEENPDYFGVELLSSIGLLGTESTLLVWMVLHLLAEPTVFDKVVSEVRTLVIVDGRPDIRDIRTTCPHLVAAWYETLRLHMTGVPRLARRDFDLDNHGSSSFALTKGDIILLPMYVFNRDPQTWGSDADDFVPGRFIDSHGRLSNGLLRKVKGYGVAGNLCPGRSFGTETSMAIAVTTLRRYDIARVDGAGFQHPEAMKGLHLGFQRYAGDVKVRLTEVAKI